jgi:hypothetical protein
MSVIARTSLTCPHRDGGADAARGTSLLSTALSHAGPNPAYELVPTAAELSGRENAAQSLVDVIQTTNAAGGAPGVMIPRAAAQNPAARHPGRGLAGIAP